MICQQIFIAGSWARRATIASPAMMVLPDDFWHVRRGHRAQRHANQGAKTSTRPLRSAVTSVPSARIAGAAQMRWPTSWSKTCEPLVVLIAYRCPTSLPVYSVPRLSRAAEL